MHVSFVSPRCSVFSRVVSLFTGDFFLGRRTEHSLLKNWETKVRILRASGDNFPRGSLLLFGGRDRGQIKVVGSLFYGFSYFRSRTVPFFQGITRKMEGREFVQCIYNFLQNS